MLYIEDLYKLLEFLWAADRAVFPHERLRLQVSLFMLIIAFTSARPGSIVQAGYAFDNEALKYADIRVLVARNPSEPDRNVIIMEITLILTKGHRQWQKREP